MMIYYLNLLRNVLVGDSLSEVKLADFGLVSTITANLTTISSILGAGHD